ncbi:Protein of unknown function [Pyronema omphalodes CBS 100304]|uniref:Uncharacterized protein n=1 Tax=Pyronema omphalodes (strain CBS 100304) TaxID=1076935 RepID=U4LL54_PYROM|nr:Protein of unknown function [Pyronema omphalodes CBS 100304]
MGTQMVENNGMNTSYPYRETRRGSRGALILMFN